MYYLGTKVEPVSDVDAAWVLCLWPDGKLWAHWYEQLHEEPWGG